MLKLYKQWAAIKRLKETMRPDPAYRERRLSQFTPARRERYLQNVAKAYSEDA